MTSMMEVGNGEEEEDLSDVVHDVSRPLDEWPPPPPPLLDSSQKNNLNPVSYTHLDVYKRQF